MTTLAAVPARMGSVRIPGKNLRLLAGKPLVCWTIEAATGAESVDRVCVTSEADEVLGLASRYEVDLVRRPDALADDETPAVEAVVHALRQYPAGTFDAVCMLLPTSPFRTARQIDEAVALAHERAANVVSVTVLESRTLLEVGGGQTRPIGFPVAQSNGAVQVSQPDWLQRHESFHAGVTLAYPMDPDTGLDIDTPRDWAVAQYLAKRQRRNAA